MGRLRLPGLPAPLKMRLAQIALRELAGPFRITTLFLEDRTNDKEVVVLPRRLMVVSTSVRPPLLLLLVLSFCFSGCAAMIQDVHLYYQQMAINFKEAEEKAKLDALTLERKSADLLQGGELHKYNRAQKELAKIKNWQEYCARQHERFVQAAQKTAGPADTKKDADQETQPPTP
ncbi:MAG: hypothetical protein ABSH35_25175 [Isosphaeraceae bacterium]